MKKNTSSRGDLDKPSFEDSYQKIEWEIEKRRPTWTYNYAWMDYDDVKMMILDHINKKWYLYDNKFPLLNWVNRIISNQIKNLIRNLYGHFAPPCASCIHYFHDGSCGLYGKPSKKCDLYSEWSLKKREKFNIRMAVTAENHKKEISEIHSQEIDFIKSFDSIIVIAKRELNPVELKVFNFLYVDHKSDLEVMRILNYKPVVIDNKKYCKQLDIIKRRIIEKIKKNRNEIDISIN